MTVSDAPLFLDCRPGPEDGAAHWVAAPDGIGLRVATWGRDAEKGTVLIFPGRTEYVEKYGEVASQLLARGFASAAIDWRGQGLADRMLEDRRIGHVGDFSEYQLDVGAYLRAAQALDLPKPWYLLGHSMGGCIGLRALHQDLPVAAAAFSAPMWGIRIAPALQPVAWVLTRAMPAISLGSWIAPTTLPEPYVLAAPFEDNKLTTDPEMHQMMRDQVTAHPDLCLGGPSYDWLGAAISECAALAEMPSPQVPCVAFQGTNERIVHVPRIEERMAKWPGADLVALEDGEHEVLMERPATRTAIFDRLATHFAA